MKLPPTNSITLPPTNDGLMVADVTDPPVAWWDTEALRQLLPRWAQQGNAQVRDAILRALGRMAARAAAGASRALNAQRTPRDAAEEALDEWGRDLQQARAAGETDAAYRARLMAATDRISPRAIKAALQQLALAAGAAIYTQEPHRIGAYYCDNASSWPTFYSSPAQRWWATDPVADTAGGERGGAIYTDASALRPLLWVFVRQAVDFDDSLAMAAGAGLTPRPADYFMGATSSWQTFVSGSSAAGTVERVASVLASGLAAGIAWRIYFDPMI